MLISLNHFVGYKVLLSILFYSCVYGQNSGKYMRAKFLEKNFMRLSDSLYLKKSEFLWDGGTKFDVSFYFSKLLGERQLTAEDTSYLKQITDQGDSELAYIETDALIRLYLYRKYLFGISNHDLCSTFAKSFWLLKPYYTKSHELGTSYHTGYMRTDRTPMGGGLIPAHDLFPEYDDCICQYGKYKGYGVSYGFESLMTMDKRQWGIYSGNKLKRRASLYYLYDFCNGETTDFVYEYSPILYSNYKMAKLYIEAINYYLQYIDSIGLAEPYKRKKEIRKVYWRLPTEQEWNQALNLVSSKAIHTTIDRVDAENRLIDSLKLKDYRCFLEAKLLSTIGSFSYGDPYLYSSLMWRYNLWYNGIGYSNLHHYSINITEDALRSVSDIPFDSFEYILPARQRNDNWDTTLRYNIYTSTYFPPDTVQLFNNYDKLILSYLQDSLTPEFVKKSFERYHDFFLHDSCQLNYNSPLYGFYQSKYYDYVFALTRYQEPEESNTYNLIGGVWEIVEEEGIAKGGDVLIRKEEFSPDMRRYYQGAELGLGFRAIVEVSKLTDAEWEAYKQRQKLRKQEKRKNE